MRERVTVERKREREWHRNSLTELRHPSPSPCIAVVEPTPIATTNTVPPTFQTVRVLHFRQQPRHPVTDHRLRQLVTDPFSPPSSSPFNPYLNRPITSSQAAGIDPSSRLSFRRTAKPIRLQSVVSLHRRITRSADFQIRFPIFPPDRTSDDSLLLQAEAVRQLQAGLQQHRQLLPIHG
ncbi:hypothetical protein PIB30_034797 [Stylosanthes scabra]|uniref:Uncharacterized protein n=1 Tax=Stylosanthes scabra TaxID=79078 RepID=A0ABU6SCR2_9FABA|nr:hypothetical protein [Stylosanthes scabra]